MPDVNKVLRECEGDISRYDGHLGMSAKGKRANLLLESRAGDSFPREDILLNSILPEGLSVPLKYAEKVAREGTRKRSKSEMKAKDRRDQRRRKKSLQQVNRR